MAYRGLFIGIDRHASSAVGWLSCARRDAVALHALFADTFGSGGDLLTDSDATREAIQGRFTALASAAPDDLVVVAFSGHGTPTHELVTYDADPSDLTGTCIPLGMLHEWFDRTPSRRLVCILDCCFSGGVGAKVLQVDAQPRHLYSAHSSLDQLSGRGRLVLTASTATEEAWEHASLGHGLLTHALIGALQGAEEVRDAGKVPVYRLLEFVTRRVTDAAARVGRPQHPTLRGEIDGELAWPVFCPGPAYRAAFPERVRAPATADLQSLFAFGFPQGVIDAWAGSIPGLNQLQLDAINEFGLLDRQHLVVSAPTSSGKTMVGELAAVRGVLDRRRGLFLLPLKALVNDKHQEFVRKYGPFGMRIIRATGEIADDIPDLMAGRYDICLMTYEKASAMLIGSPHLMEQVGTIVVDEVQMIADASRGANLEFLLTLLRVRRREDIGPQLVALSAVIGDTNGLERWLGARLLRRMERPVPLEEGVLRADGTFRYVDPVDDQEKVRQCIRPEWRKGSSQDLIIPLLRRLMADGKQVIVFRETKSETVKVAQYLARELGLGPARNALASLPNGDPSVASGSLRASLASGVAFHNADLDREERQVIEEQFRATDGGLRVIVATTTLAMGVNTPAEAVVIAGLEHPGNEPYSVAEYKNIVGRAGRLGFAEAGTSYLIALTPQAEHMGWSRYVRGRPEDLQSRFLSAGTDPRSLVLRVLAATPPSAVAIRQGLTPDEVVDFLEGSFGAFRQRQVAEAWRWDRAHFERAVSELRSHGLLEVSEHGGLLATALGQLAGEGGVEVESILRLLMALRPTETTAITDATLVAATQLTAELDDVLFPFNKASKYKEPQTWAAELQNQQVAGPVQRVLFQTRADRHTPTLRAKKAVACLLWITDYPMERIEQILTQFGGLGGAAGPVRSVASRTCDLLPTVVRVAELLNPGLDLSERAAELLLRIELGVPRAMVEIARRAGNTLARGDYLRLLQARLLTPDAIEAAEVGALLPCLGGSTQKLRALRTAQRAELGRTPVRPQSPILPPPEG